MSIWSDIKREIDIIVRHNPEHIASLKLTVGEDVTTLKADGVQLFTTFLQNKGLAVGSLAEQAITAALGVLASAEPAQVTSPVVTPKPAPEPDESHAE